MANDTVHQALFGYARGHRMLVSSCSLPAEAAHVLRAATDTAVERPDRRYLTVLPLPDLRAQAFIRTWPAEEWLRPGSVWSHVLLVDFVTLANMTRLDGLTALFRRPELEPGGQSPDLNLYRHALPITDARPGRPLADSVDPTLAEQIVGAVYGTEGRVVIGVDNAVAAESTLLAIYEQQWPRLRRHFSFRTRMRSSEGSTPYDLDIVERARSRAVVEPQTQGWIGPLLDDLVGGGGDLRNFLRTFGSGADAGRRDMPALVVVHTNLVKEPAPVALGVLCRTFPHPRQMTGLKASLLGIDERRGWTPPNWPLGDPDRLVLLFSAPPSAIDYDSLKVGERIATAVQTDPAAAADALHRLDLERLPPPLVQTIVSGIIDDTDDELAAAIAGEQPDLGVLLVAQRPLLLGRPNVWATLDADLLVDVFARASADQQDATLRALLDASADEALITLCASAPVMWWDLLFTAARPGVDATSLALKGEVLRRVLGRIGSAAIGAPQRNPQTFEQLMALLVSADLSTGLWRHAPPEVWVDLWQSAGAADDTIPSPLRDRLATVALLAATSSGSRPLRIAAWRDTFPHLHRALAHAAFDDEAWGSLAAALPAAPEWDRCLRLRRGAVSEVRRDRWSSDDTTSLLAASERYRAEMLDELQAMPTRKKSKHWLRQLIDAIRP